MYIKNHTKEGAQERREREIRRVMKFYFIKGLHNEHEKDVVY